MYVSIEHIPEGEFAVTNAHPADEPDPQPGPEDEVRVVRAFAGDAPKQANRSKEKQNKSDPEEGFRLIAAFVQIEHADVRRAVIELAESLAKVRSRA